MMLKPQQSKFVIVDQAQAKLNQPDRWKLRKASTLGTISCRKSESYRSAGPDSKNIPDGPTYAPWPSEEPGVPAKRSPDRDAES